MSAPDTMPPPADLTALDEWNRRRNITYLLGELQRTRGNEMLFRGTLVQIRSAIECGYADTALRIIDRVLAEVPT